MLRLPGTFTKFSVPKYVFQLIPDISDRDQLSMSTLGVIPYTIRLCQIASARISGESELRVQVDVRHLHLVVVKVQVYRCGHLVLEMGAGLVVTCSTRCFQALTFVGGHFVAEEIGRAIHWARNYYSYVFAFLI